MASYAQNKDFAEMILTTYPLDAAIDYVQKNMNPGDVFEERDLIRWAEQNGYIKDEGDTK